MKNLQKIPMNEVRSCLLGLSLALLSACPPPAAAAPDKPGPDKKIEETLSELQRRIDLQQEDLRSLRNSLPARSAFQGAGPGAMSSSSGLFLRVEPQWLSVYGLETEFAARNNSAACPGGAAPCLSASGTWATIATSNAFIPKVTAGFVLPGGNGVLSVGGFHVEASGSRRFHSPDGVIGAAPLDPFDEITNQGGNSLPLPNSADAVNKFTIDQIDFDYQRPVRLDGVELSFETGIRTLFFKNEVATEFTHGDRRFNFSLARASRSAAGGPKAGLAANWRILDGPVSLRVKAGSGYLLGYNEASQVLCQGRGFAQPGCGGRHSVNSRKSQGFPFIEGDFAVHFQPRQAPGLGMAAGYNAANYFGLVTLPETSGGPLDIAGTGFPSVQRDIFRRHDVMITDIFLRLQYVF